MADVKKYTDQIAKAQKGRDVRDSIVNAINEVSDENNEYNQVKADILSAQSDIAEKVIKNEQTEQTFAADVERAEELKQGLDTDITQGTALKSQLDAAVETADTSKKNLDASNTAAGKTKTDLDASNATASEAKTGLDATNKTAADLVASLGDKITEGTQVKTDIQTTGETAMSNLQAEATKQQEYIKTSIDDTLSISGKAADAAVTGKKISSLKEDLSTKITKFYTSSQGETHLADSDNGKIQDMMVYGKSEQKQYSGKNLLNATLQTTTQNGVTCTNNGDGTYTLNGKLSSNTIFTLFSGSLSIDNKSKIILMKNDTFADLGIVSSYCAFKISSSWDDAINYPTIKEIPSGKIVQTINLILRLLNGGDPVTLTNVLIKPMIVDASLYSDTTYDDFEPYTGGIPSPNPDYPQEIKSVVNPAIKICGKNLFKATLGNVTANGITCTANSDGTYILNGTCTVSTALSIIGIFNHILNEPLYLTGVPSGCGSYLALGRRDGNNILVTDGKNTKIDAGIHTKYIEFWITKGTTLNNVIFKPMLTTDPTATYDDFEPYHEQTVTLPYTLNAIPVETGGNVTIGSQEYIADYVDVERGKLVKMVDDVEAKNYIWQLYPNANNMVRRFGMNDANRFNMPDNINVISPHFKQIAYTGKHDLSVWFQSYYLVVTDTNEKWKNSEALIQWFSENNVHFYLPLKTPEEIDLATEEIAAFKALATYYPTTNISVNSEQLDGYTVFNYPTPFEDEWIKTQKEIGGLKEDFVNLKEYVKGTNFPETWEQVVLAIKSKLHREMYAVGDKFSNIWKDTNDSNKEYDNPLRINHFEDGLELEDGTTVNGMWLQTVYAHLKGVQFSHQQAFYVSDEGMAAGTYCVGFDYTWGSNGYVNKGDYWNFTLTNDVPAGAKLAGFYGAPSQPQTSWKVYIYSADGKTVLETVSTVNKGQEGTLLGVMTAYGDENLNGIQQMAYGDNRYATSAIRQYLNSNKPKGEWWTAQTKWDIAPDQLNQIDGYLCGMEPELLAVLQPIKVVTYCNTVTAIGQKQIKDITYDKVILISLEQMYIEPQAVGEGEAHEYYKELNGTGTKFQWWQTYEILKTFTVESPTTLQYVRLRSAYRNIAYDTWSVRSGGSVSSDSASYAIRVAPLMFIGVAPSDTISAPTDAESTQEDKSQDAVV